jgi:hypothetical protein
MRNEEPVPEHWRTIASMAKEPLGWPVWPEIELPKPRTAQTRADLVTKTAECTRIVIPLARVDGEGIEGVRLRITAWPFRRQYDVTATLEVEGGRSFVTIARLDAWPPDGHLNGVSRQHRNLLNVPAEVIGDHVHRFEDNATLGRSAFAPHGNLPIARAIDKPITSFKQFLATVELEFNISGLRDWPSPQWGDLI